MAKLVTDILQGGRLVDKFGRRQVVLTDVNAASPVSDTPQGGYLEDGDGREVLAVQANQAGSVFVVPGPSINTTQVLQSNSGQADVFGVPNIGGPNTGMVGTYNTYADSGAGNIFQHASFVYNTGSRATVAVFGFGKGNHVWGSNLIGYTSGVQDGDTVIGLEINAGILGTPNTGIATSLVLANKGGRTLDGLPNQAPYIQMQASTNAECKYGIRTHVSGGVQAVDSTGTLWLNDGTQTHILGLDWSATTFTDAAIKLAAGNALYLLDGANIKLQTATGTKIGTSPAQKLGFFNATPVVQQTLAAAATDAGTTQTLANSLRTALINLGLGA